MNQNEKQRTIMNMLPWRQHRRQNNPYDTSVSSSAISSAYEIPYSINNLPKSQYTPQDTYSYLDIANNNQREEEKKEEGRPMHFLYGISSSHTSI